MPPIQSAVILQQFKGFKHIYCPPLLIVVRRTVNNQGCITTTANQVIVITNRPTSPIYKSNLTDPHDYAKHILKH